MFNEGDNISGENISMGKYIGKCKLHGKEFHKIFDRIKNLTLFIPTTEEKKIRKLPAKSIVQGKLNIFESENLIDVQEIEGSRYKYLKEKIKMSTFSEEAEVIHDLHILKKSKQITSSERKLFNFLKEKFLNEVSFIMGQEYDYLENKIFN